MELTVQSLILVSFLMSSLIVFCEKFGGSPLGAIYEKIEDKKRVDHYNRVALDHLKSKHHWKGSNLTILSTTESICNSSHLIKVDILYQNKWRREHGTLFLNNEGKIIPPEGPPYGSSKYFDRSDKAATELNGKIVFHHLREKTGLKYEKPSFLGLETYSDKGEKGYVVLVYSLNKEQKKEVKALGVVSKNGTLEEFHINKGDIPNDNSCFVR